MRAVVSVHVCLCISARVSVYVCFSLYLCLSLSMVVSLSLCISARSSAYVSGHVSKWIALLGPQNSELRLKKRDLGAPTFGEVPICVCLSMCMSCNVLRNAMECNAMLGYTLYCCTVSTANMIWTKRSNSVAQGPTSVHPRFRRALLVGQLEAKDFLAATPRLLAKVAPALGGRSCLVLWVG